MGFSGGFELFYLIPRSHTVTIYYYRDSPHSTNFMPPGNRNVGKIVLFGDWFSTKIAIYDFWIVKVPFFLYFWPVFNENLWVFNEFIPPKNNYTMMD